MKVDAIFKFRWAKMINFTTHASSPKRQCPCWRARLLATLPAPLNKRNSFVNVISTCPCYCHLPNIVQIRIFIKTQTFDKSRLCTSFQDFPRARRGKTGALGFTKDMELDTANNCGCENQNTKMKHNLRVNQTISSVTFWINNVHSITRPGTRQRRNRTAG